jgi:hypothetical protein
MERTEVPEYQLFDLATDPAETKNVLAENPAIAAELITRLDDLIKSDRSR